MQMYTHRHQPVHTKMIILIVLSMLLGEFAITATAQDSKFVYGFRCTNSGNYTPNSSFQFSLYNLLGNLTTEASNTQFYQASYGQTPDQVFAHFICRADMDSQGCSNCVYTAKDMILKRCPYQTGALIWYDKCMVRFSNVSFFNRVDFIPELKLANAQNVTGNRTLFAQLLRDTMHHLAVQAADDEQPGRKFASTSVRLNLTSFPNLYGHAQCIPDLMADDCIRCLRNGIRQLAIATGAWLLQPSCCIRYENYSYLNQIRTTNFSLLPSISKSGSRHHTMLWVSIGFSICISISLGVGIWICMCKRRSAKKSNAEMKEIRTADSLQYDLNAIRVATRNFAVENKLGEGGFGEVYKGILEHGQEVAIKRLSDKSGQGVEEFKNEVLLVAKLQHKNLARLLGFCLSSTEKILVYEFLHNSSLDRFLFDATKKVSLDWETRFKLIIGIARGLLYLHEDSRLKVIHRDLKPSNILLDENMNPKISDFGLAKLFGVDQTQDSTKRIVGTYGYMAPEYAMTGHFSVKSDVYSFGIIILEIVSGQRNRFFGRHQIEEALLYRAWKLWNDGKALYLVDTTLANKYPKEEVIKCIHIALLCIQEHATERPRMTAVVAALNGQSIGLSMPKPPNFFGNTSTNEERSSANYDVLMGGNEVDENHQELDQQCYSSSYTGGSENITELYPR